MLTDVQGELSHLKTSLPARDDEDFLKCRIQPHFHESLGSNGSTWGFRSSVVSSESVRIKLLKYLRETFPTSSSAAKNK